MKAASVCSGIGAPECAWKDLGIEFVFCSETEAFPSAVLRHHYPEVGNLGDFTGIGEGWSIDLLVGGTPCQDFSVAGLRAGMDGRPAADGPRYKALGNAMAVPVMRWIGERILAVEKFRA